MFPLYTLSVRAYGTMLRLAAPFHKKAALWVNGRKNWKFQLKQNSDSSGKKIWFHCSSLGEFEQGRPVMEALLEKNPDAKLYVSFFSPSGYEVRKNYENAHYAFYLPLDTKSNAKFILDTINPDYVFFVKYEFWFNYIKEINKRNIPLFNISGIFRPKQHFFKSYGAWFRKQLRNFSWFFLQDNASKDLLKSIGIENASQSGDTRFDRVESLLREKKELPLIEEFSKDSLTIFGGSSWETELEFLNKLLEKRKDFKLVLAPHEVHEENIKKIQNTLVESSIRYTKTKSLENSDSRILIIDCIGVLAYAYKYADLSLIGGGFNDGLHNVLEAVTWGSPVFFGPKHTHFPESFQLIENKGGFLVQDSEEFLNKITPLMDDENKREQHSKICISYARTNSGVTSKILKTLDSEFNI